MLPIAERNAFNPVHPQQAVDGSQASGRSADGAGEAEGFPTSGLRVAAVVVAQFVKWDAAEGGGNIRTGTSCGNGCNGSGKGGLMDCFHDIA
jgi:hypothetical protein